MENASVSVRSASLSLMSSLKEAWRLVHGMKWKIFLLSVLFIVAMTVVNSIFILVFGDLFAPTIVAEEGAKVAHFSVGDLLTPSGYAFLFIELLVSWFVLTVFIMLGVKQATGVSPKLRETFLQCIHCGGRYFGLMALFIIVSLIGVSAIGSFDVLEALNFSGSFIALLLVRFIFWFIAAALTQFALPLIVNKNLSLANAVAVGFSAMFQHWFKILVLFIVMYILLVISALPLGIGLIWTLPMLAALQGVIFKEVING